MSMNNRPQTGGLTPLSKIIIVMLVLAIGYFGYNYMTKGGGGAGGGDASQFKKVDMSKISSEAADTKGITTVQEYKYVPQEKLPQLDNSMVSSYKKLDKKDPVIEFPINVWIGWLPIIAANHGYKPSTESYFYKKYGFKVNITLIDDPVSARDAFASGKSHVLWGTLDMMALFAPTLVADPRTSPRVCQIVDWSNGGDGIVVRDSIKSVADLKGKTIVYAQNSPSQYYVNNLLLTSGVQPNEVTHKFTDSPFSAATAFVASTGKKEQIDAVVSWAPDIYSISEKVPGTRLLSTTQDANKVIADVWAVRADFERDNPKIVKGLVEGIFAGMDMLKDEAYKKQACKWLGDLYGYDVNQVKDMLADAHSTNFAENQEFFLNANNPSNFERTWKNINFVYRELGLIDSPVPFDRVMDFTYIKALKAEGKFKDHKDTYSTPNFAPSSFSKVKAESPIITQTIRINFYPNSWNILEPAHDESGQPIKDSLYDPSAPASIEKAARLAGQFGSSRIAIVGHSDSSKKGQVREESVKTLSLNRAKAVKDMLVKNYKFDPNKFVVEGMGWDQPFDPANPYDQTKNRRVEIMVYQLEEQ